MMDWLNHVLAFIVAIGILVTIHEAGHFWVARRLGVKVLRFSIGFGPVLWSIKRRPAAPEFALSAIPLGGYVQMLDEREGEVDPAEQHLAFNRQSVAKRLAIVAAGPIANFLFAIVAYALMFMVGVVGLQPIIGDVEPGSPAARAGFASGDEILAVGETEVRTWDAANLQIIEQVMARERVTLWVATAGGGQAQRILPLTDSKRLLSDGSLFAQFGFSPWRPPIAPVIGELRDGEPAAQAGLQTGDRLLAVNGQRLERWSEWVDYIQAHPDQRLEVTLRRDGSERTLTLQPRAVQDNGATIGRIGAGPQVDEQAYRERLQRYQITLRYGPLQALQHGLAKTWEISVLTVKVMLKLVTGEVSVRSISGPLSIAEYAGVTAMAGLATFLSFLGLVSVSLGLLNLLPIPLLDGGHIMFYLVEAIKGSPVSELTEEIAHRVGIVLLAALMSLALYNDLTRMLG